jgi:hypothetical protein
MKSLVLTAVASKTDSGSVKGLHVFIRSTKSQRFNLATPAGVLYKVVPYNSIQIRGGERHMMKKSLLIVLASLTFPAFGDSFNVGSSMTVTLPELTGLSYSLVYNIPLNSPAVQGTGIVSYGNESFSWNNGELSYSFDPASGTVTPPSGMAPYQGEYIQQIKIANGTGSTIQLPLTVSLAYSGNVTGPGDPNGQTNVLSEAYLQTHLINSAGGALFWADLNCTASQSIFAYASADSCTTRVLDVNSDEFVITQGLLSPVSTSGFALIPAHDFAFLNIVATSQGLAYDTPNVPEPESLLLCGTGLLGLAGAWRERRRANFRQ